MVDVAAGGPVVLDAGVADDASAPPPPRNQEQFTLKYSKRMRSNKLKKPNRGLNRKRDPKLKSLSG